MELDFPISYLFPTELSPSARSLEQRLHGTLSQDFPHVYSVLYSADISRAGLDLSETARAGISPIPQRCTRLAESTWASSQLNQCYGAFFFLRGIRMYHDSTMLENAKAMPRVAAIVLSL